MLTARVNGWDKIGVNNILQLPVGGFVVSNINNIAALPLGSNLLIHALYLPDSATNGIAERKLIMLAKACQGYNVVSLTLFNEIVINETDSIKPLSYDLLYIAECARSLFPDTDLLIGDYRCSDLDKWRRVLSLASSMNLGIWLQVQHEVRFNVCSIAKFGVYYNLYKNIALNYPTYCSEVSFWGTGRYQCISDLYSRLKDKVKSFGPWVTDSVVGYNNMCVDSSLDNVSWLNKGKRTELAQCLGIPKDNELSVVTQSQHCMSPQQ